MRALLVDLDDTILDYSGGVDASWREAAESVAASAGVELEALVRSLEWTRRWFWGDPERHRRERLDMPGAWRKIAARALERIGAPAHPFGAALGDDFAARRRAALQLFPGAVGRLEELRAGGVELALVTNGDARQQRDKIERFDLARLFDCVVIEGEFGAGKPEEVVYRHVLAALEATPAEAWMVGDNLEWDVAAPQRLGLRGVWVDPRGQGVPAESPVRPDSIIRSLRELEGPF
jgi:putative hydrolase of the HAD superfamily